jgi:hypothetical protein
MKPRLYNVSCKIPWYFYWLVKLVSVWSSYMPTDVDEEISKLIDDEKYAEARKKLDEYLLTHSNSPFTVRLDTMISFLSDWEK